MDRYRLFVQGKFFSIAIPNTILSDSTHLRDKTTKIGTIARICSIFKVNSVYIYKDNNEKFGEEDIIKTILEYLDTPQYLRKHFYGINPILSYAGLLPPLRTPHHKLAESSLTIKSGDYRDGFIVEKNGETYADVGLPELIPIDGKSPKQLRITVKFISEYPELRCKLIRREDVNEYWGYEVRTVSSITDYISASHSDMIILTSRKGRSIVDMWWEIISEIKDKNNVGVVFGSPKHGIYEMLSKEGVKPESLSKYIMNIVPQQGVATIRSEEAILSTLTILNLAINLGKQM